MSPQPVVYVVQETNHSLLKAQVFGTLKVLLPRGGSPVRDTATAGRLRQQLEGVEPDDWLLPVGDPAAIALAAVEMARVTGRVRLLRWNQQLDDYEPLEFML